jgi:phosphate transport system substrate-binding protein
MISAAVGSANAADITGAGSTFVYPILSKWAAAYKKETDIGLNYQSIGSGGGIKQITNKTVTFGASDAPLKGAQLDKLGLAQFPIVMGGIVPVVNVSGIKAGELVIDGPTLAKIYLGEVKTWNDPALKKLNPKAKLPNAAIAVVHRSDGSGTTFNFAYYLSDVSPAWKSKVGFNTSVEWPAGIGGKGNEGVSNYVANTKNSIGYVEYAYALQNKLTYTRMMNKAGKIVSPTSAWLWCHPRQSAERRVVADDGIDLGADVQKATGRPKLRGGAQVLRLGLQGRRQDGGEPRLHSDARLGRGADRGDVEKRHQGCERQTRLRDEVTS